MTYPPPHPAGPGPYGQPGYQGQPYGGPGGGAQPPQQYPQQYPQQHPQQGGWDAFSPAPQQPQGGWEQQGWQQAPAPDQYAQPGGWDAFNAGPQQPQHPGGFGEEPPKKKKTGLIVGLAVGAVVVIGGAVAAVVLLTGEDGESAQVAQQNPTSQAQEPGGQVPPPATGGPSSGKPGGTSGDTGSASDKSDVRAAGQKAVDAINERDVNLAKEVACSPETVSQADIDEMPQGVEAKVVGEPVITGNTATIDAELSFQGETEKSPIKLTKEAGGWCVGS